MNNTEDLAVETWKDVVEWEQFYSISNLGRLKSKHQDRILNPAKNSGGFHTELRGKNDGKRHRFFVHYLVWWTFVTGKIYKNIKLHHKNENNLDNSLENLLDITDNNDFRCCKECHISKPISQFELRKDNNLYRRQCNECMSDKSKDYYSKNTERIKSNTQLRYKRNKPKIQKQNKEYYEKNKIWLNKKCSLRKQEREKTDPKFKCRRRYKSLLYNTMVKQGVSKNRRPSSDFVGCDWEFFKSHIESQFKNGMNWNNYGDKGWHFGHKICCELFDLTDERQVKICFHYSNIRPENWLENITNQDFLPDGRRARDLSNEEKKQYLNSIGIDI